MLTVLTQDILSHRGKLDLYLSLELQDTNSRKKYDYFIGDKKLKGKF
jgi:hypothetical protein